MRTAKLLDIKSKLSPFLCTYLATTLRLVVEKERLSYPEGGNYELPRETEETRNKNV